MPGTHALYRLRSRVQSSYIFGMQKYYVVGTSAALKPLSAQVQLRLSVQVGTRMG